jgi:hypothetical protein
MLIDEGFYDNNSSRFKGLPEIGRHTVGYVNDIGYNHKTEGNGEHHNYQENQCFFHFQYSFFLILHTQAYLKSCIFFNFYLKNLLTGKATEFA